ncbi:MAG: hypothetical protein KIS94_01905 [Chitinophagales bacterium]|nr:hypothetical protein [Chitinophagales bacterium]
MKFKHIILTTFLSLFVVSGLWAQDKYEYATLTFEDKLVMFTQEKVQVFRLDTSENAFRGTMRRLNTLSGLGWDVYQVTETLLSPLSDVTRLTYHLRRKKTNNQ